MALLAKIGLTQTVAVGSFCFVYRPKLSVEVMLVFTCSQELKDWNPTFHAGGEKELRLLSSTEAASLTLLVSVVTIYNRNTNDLKILVT